MNDVRIWISKPFAIGFLLGFIGGFTSFAAFSCGEGNLRVILFICVCSGLIAGLFVHFTAAGMRRVQRYSGKFLPPYFSPTIFVAFGIGVIVSPGIMQVYLFKLLPACSPDWIWILSPLFAGVLAGALAALAFASARLGWLLITSWRASG